MTDKETRARIEAISRMDPPLTWRCEVCGEEVPFVQDMEFVKQCAQGHAKPDIIVQDCTFHGLGLEAELRQLFLQNQENLDAAFRAHGRDSKQYAYWEGSTDALRVVLFRVEARMADAGLTALFGNARQDDS